MPSAPSHPAASAETATPGTAEARSLDILCFSHLRWDFVTQRPQHLMTRAAATQRVFFWEEPWFDADDNGDGTPTLEMMQRGPQLWVMRPHLPRAGDADRMQQALLHDFLHSRHVERFVAWYYTPMALGFTGGLAPVVTVYDCMDELSNFLGAPPLLREREQLMFDTADVVFTGGMSLYEAKRTQHANVHAFPSSIDVDHFARRGEADPADQAQLAHPRAGFFGVLDERFDHALLKQAAALLPQVQFVLIGPVVKIDPATLPQAANIHYLGGKDYQQLPAYLEHWEVALLPFALNESTRFISPTKTPEYLAAGKPVVSTPIHDVIAGYGNDGLVRIAATPADFAQAIAQSLEPQSAGWSEAVATRLSTGSWNQTWRSMWSEIERVMVRSAGMRIAPVAPLRATPVTVRVHTRRAETFDTLVVGAGFAGAVLAERLANERGERVLVIDKRDHIAGNAFDYLDEAGILVHRYGPHIFHTNSTEVVEYLSRFTAWRPFEHRVLASVDGMLVPIPINLDTINTLYGLNLDAEGMEDFLARRQVRPAHIRTSEDIVVSRVGRELYEKFFRNYTRKQWGLDPSELDSSVAGRIPVRFNRDDRYFADSFQAMPAEGYTRMFERMLDAPGITVRTGCDYRDVMSQHPGIRTVYTGPVDEFFDYRFGPLPYRSLQFEHKTFPVEQYQSAPVVNYPNEHAYTRVTEFKYLTGQTAASTSVVFEYPSAEGDPYYPVPRPENAALYARYKALADAQQDVTFVGRLATYRYYNMDQVVAQALAVFRQLAPRKTPVATLPAAPSILTQTAR